MMIKRNIFAILTALAATTLLATGCGGDVECGKGTSEKDGKCVATDASAETCGAGTVLADGKCVLDNSGCGAGTTLVDGACVPSADSCGDGTTLDTATGQCVSNSNIECGAGTVDVDGKCQPAADNCTAGTKLEGGKCVIDPTACGTGTALDANTGICSPAAEACGVGLGFTDGKCVPTEELCDAGTIFSEDTGLCLPEATCKIGDEIVEGICLSPAEALFKHPDAKSIDGEPTLDMPAVDERLIFTGTIAKPVEEADGSFTNNVDKFTFVGEAGQYVKLTLQALGAVDLVFEVEGPEGINARNYVRTSSVGVEVVPARYVYIPYDGEYTVTVQPALGWLLDLNADGGEGFEFAGTLEQLEAPTATNITVDKVVPAPLSGNSRALLNNLYKVEGAADGDLVTFSFNDFGIDASSSIFVLDNATPPAVIAEFNNIDTGGSFNVPGTTEGFQILVDNNLVAGPKTQFDISGRINGVIKNVIIDVDDAETITGIANENTILKISLEADAGTKLSVSVLDSADVQLGKAGTVEPGNAFFMFYSVGGEFTVNLENNGQQAISAKATVEYITPLDVGTLITDDEKDHLVPSHKVGDDIFLLINTAPDQVLAISLETGASYVDIQMLLNDILYAQIWTENGNKLFTHSVEDLFIPGNAAFTLTNQGQYVALRLSHVPAGVINAGGEESNKPYNRTGYEIRFDSMPLSHLPETDPGFVVDDEFEVETTEDMEEDANDFYLITVAESVQLSALIEENEDGDVDMILYDMDFNQIAFGDYSLNEVLLTTGSYVLRVNSYDATTGGYYMHGNFTPAPVIQVATGTNTSIATADKVNEYPVILRGNSFDGANADHQYWEVSFPTNTTVSITGTHISGSGWMRYRIYDTAAPTTMLRDSNYIHEDAAAGSSVTGSFVFQAGKTYVIRVGGVWPNFNDPYAYQIKMKVTGN